MISYAKIWTSIFNDEWFLGLSLSGRGLWLQLLVWAKMVGDSGLIACRNHASLSTVCGCERDTFAKFLRIFNKDGKVVIHEGDGRGFTIEIVNYHYWQGLRSGKEFLNVPKNPRKSAGKTAKPTPQPDHIDNTIDNISILDSFNLICISLPKIKSLKDDRLKRVLNLQKSYPDLDWWKQFFERVQLSPWLTGTNPKGWTADFDWILTTKNIRRILEGVFDKRENNNGEGFNKYGGLRAKPGKYKNVGKRDN